VIILAFVVAVAMPAGAQAAETKVVATIKPVHSLVAQVMLGVGSPELLVKGTTSPHAFAMRPSDARALHAADLVFRMSDAMEPFTTKIVKTLPRSVETVTLQAAPGMKLLAVRTGATFERHAAAKDAGHAHDHGHRQAGEAVDGHAWLDPDNAMAMVDRIAQALSARYPAGAGAFRANASAAKTRIAALAAELDRTLQPLADRPYIVFHDAIQYLERRYGLNVVGSISVSPEVPPSGKRLAELRRKIVTLNAVCVLAEPAFERRLIDNLIEGTSARTGTLDPEGAVLEPGPDLYFALMRRLAASLRDCLASPA
jgi:zinc transport system substrate-binding protein